MTKRNITLKNVRVHNLKGVDLTLPLGELIVFTGVSGSGKSSLAFDTLYVEGQRRYIESLSTFARRYLGDMSKPDLEFASGLSPTISIEQKTAGKNPRSTVGTMTEIYDYLRVLYARVGIPHCPVSGEAVAPQSSEKIIKTIEMLPEKTKVIFLAPYAQGKKGEFKDDFAQLLRKGYTRARVDGTVVDLSEEISLDKNLTHDIDILIDRFTLSPTNRGRIAEAVTSGLELGGGVLKLVNVTREEETLLSTHAYSPKSGISYSALEPHDFSFNSPTGMCETCHGLGRTLEFDLEKIINPEKSIADDCCHVASSYATVRFGNIYDNLAELYNFSVTTPWKNLSTRAQNLFLKGNNKKWTQMHFVHPTTGATWSDYVRWRGVLYEARKRYNEATSELYRKNMEVLMVEQECPSCHGKRLRPYPAAALLGGKTISEITAMTIHQAYQFFGSLKLSLTETFIAEELIKEITQRFQFLIDVGLHYLTLDRSAPTLSGGEAQRVRLASQVGCGLVGVTYVLDEPSIGLHPRDNMQLIATLKRLRDMGNTVIAVEHDEETIWAADRVVDFGPGPGKHGGEIVVNGSHEELLNSPRSITGAYLSRKKTIAIPQERRKPTGELVLKGASHNNLKKVDVTVPLGALVAVTGVSGSGKSSLITDTLYPALANLLHKSTHPVGSHTALEGTDNIDKIIAIDQSPIGRNPRSNPSTYIKIFDEVRDLFSRLPESVARGYGPGRFSFNVREGSCPQCHGMGMLRIDMDFMEDQWMPCNTCNQKRFDTETLSILYKGKSIHDILEMTVEEAAEFFRNIPTLKRKLEMIGKVGMGYITLGQPSPTLSGGEAQRIKLAKELVRPATGHTLYILDEPTTGLHFADIQALLLVLEELTDRGNTVLVIEHNMDVVKCADWVIDLGPEGGEAGGKLVATGTPEALSKKKTPTGVAIKAALSPKPPAKREAPKLPEKEITEITVKGAQQNNLKSIDLAIPRGKMTVCTGPSGSGKSSLAFETIYAEGQRRYIESLSPYARQFVKQMPKPKLAQIDGLSPAVAIEQKMTAGNPRSTIGTMTEIYDYFRVLFSHAGIAYCPETGEQIKSITKVDVAEQILSYPEGESITLLAPLELSKGDRFEDLCHRLQRQGFLRLRLNEETYELDTEIPFDRRRKQKLALVIDRLKISPKVKGRLFEAIESALRITGSRVLVLRGDQEVLFNLAFTVPSTGRSYPEITPHTFSFNSPEGMCLDCQGLGYQYGANLIGRPEIMDLSLIGLLRTLWTLPRVKLLSAWLEAEGIDASLPLRDQSKLSLILNGSDRMISARGLQFQWRGLQPVLAMVAKSGHKEIRASIIPLMDQVTCPTCQGSRLNALARHVRIEEHSIASLCALPIEHAAQFIAKISVPPLLDDVKKQLLSRLGFLCEVGLHYLSLDRRAPTLSNGEAQRIRLARQLGSSLRGVLYVLDEPTIGLHPADNLRLTAALHKLKELGNTLLLVEHDPQTIQTADYLLDFGPGAGVHGGHLTACGTLPKILANPRSLTGAYLSGKKTVSVPQKRRKATTFLKIKGAKTHNLKNLNIEIPHKVLTCLTGVSGSGKSTLLHEEILPAGQTAFEKVSVIDQNPIGHTARSDVGTYVELLPALREFYASLGLSRTKGLLPRHFSYNHRKGMCTTCWGLGYKKVEMHFLPPVRVTCDLCHGLRLNPSSLEVTYEGKSFGQLLSMTVDEARSFFEILPKAKRICDTLISVGLGYLTLGQEMASLSGGEAQRMKLSRELSRRRSKDTLYLLDEPTTGLHPEDIQKLLGVLHRLVDRGSTMVIIEHNVDVLRAADHLIELGPQAGEKGGHLIFTGTPEQIKQCAESVTRAYL